MSRAEETEQCKHCLVEIVPAPTRTTGWRHAHGLVTCLPPRREGGKLTRATPQEVVPDA